MNHKRKIDPVDGTLIGIAEVSAMTGFTPHQIRSWRKPENHDKAVFEGLRDPLSSTIWYRLIDIEDWREQHGKQSFMRAIPAPNAFRSSRAGKDIEDYGKRVNLEMLANINTATAMAWREKLSQQDRNSVMDYLKRYAEPIYAREVGEDWFAQGVASKNPITQANRYSQPIWFRGATKALRMLVNDRNNYGFTEAEIDAIPAGECPPAQEITKV